jgi:hypothetical protein
MCWLPSINDYALSRVEHRRIRAPIASVPDRTEFRDRELTASKLRDHVISILDARGAYCKALDALATGAAHTG